jgi:thiopeptide-type bacteriocin biosynthesis protein
MVDGFAGDGAADARWRLALRGMDQLLNDLGFDLATKLEILRRTRAGFGREFGVGTAVEKQLGDKFRKQRATLDALLDPARDGDSPLVELLPAFARRSAAMVDVARALRGAKLNGALESLAPSYLHMHANRMLRSAARPQELVLYDFLVRLYESRMARAKKGGGS